MREKGSVWNGKIISLKIDEIRETSKTLILFFLPNITKFRLYRD